jgi:hypothetical protein
MGGLAGHMNHLYDNPELSFAKMKDIFQKASKGELVGTEKTDGQNLFVSYSVRDKKAKSARNKSNIKAGGLDPKDLAKKFAGRGNLERAFVEGFGAFEEAVKSLPIELQVFTYRTTNRPIRTRCKYFLQRRNNGPKKPKCSQL